MFIRGSSTVFVLHMLAVSACSLDAEGRGEAAPESEPEDPGPGISEGSGLDGGNGDARLDGQLAEPHGDDASQEPDSGANVDSGEPPCSPSLELVVRDFTEQHPDFEKNGTALSGIVEPRLGPDRKPVIALSADGRAANDLTVPRRFDEWYRDVPGTNMRFSESIDFVEWSKGLFAFHSAEFFPIDGEGFGNGPMPVSNPFLDSLGISFDHNYLFTTEAHARFVYRGGEYLTIAGDDDIWVFINDRLAIDLGGIHLTVSGTINLDLQAQNLGLVRGESYVLDIFHAERHTVNSTYNIQTTIDLSCIRNVPVPL